LVQVRLENGGVEDEEGLEDLKLVLVGDGLSDLGVQVLNAERLLGLESLVTEGRHERHGLIACRVVNHGELKDKRRSQSGSSEHEGRGGNSR